MDLTALLSGLGGAGATSFTGNSSGTISLPTLGGGASTTSSIGGLLSSAGSATGGGLGSALSSIGSMATAGLAFGPVGAGIGAALGFISNIGNIFGKAGEKDHERADLKKIAAANDISEDQASWVCGLEESKVRDNYDTICARAAANNSYFLQLLAKYNQEKPNEKIVSRTVRASGEYEQLRAQVANTFASKPSANPLANLSFSGAQSAAQQQNMSLGDYLTAILNGALAGLQQGAAGAAADTPAGKEATWDVIKTQAKKYELVLVAFGLGIVALAVKAFSKK